jgi:membrane-associated protease RseP (regulator of RpoE activity)
MSVAELIPKVEPYMRIGEVKSGIRFITLEGQIYEPHNENIEAIRAVFAGTGYTPLFEPNKGSVVDPHRLKIGRFVLKGVRQRLWLNWLLLGLTLLTTTIGGAMWAGVDIFTNPLLIWKGLPYSLALILILGSHELGHYLTCRRYGIPATPPFFIPFIPPFGTMGAVIRMGLTDNRRTLIRVGAAGPIVGFIVAVPVVVVGLMLSEVVPQNTVAGGFQFGESLIFQFLALVVKGPMPENSTILIHPIALAGWLGFLVTALNLLPLSQLDGGHIAYGLFGKRRIYIMIPVYALMLSTAFIFKSWNWMVWGVLTLIFGFRHPPAADEITPLEPLDIIIAIVALIILILTVMPVPIQITPPTLPV